MVLAELQGQISSALLKMSNVTLVDQRALQDCINEITRALFQADVSVKLVMTLASNIKKAVNPEKLAAGHDKRKIMQQVVFTELCGLLDAGKPAYTPRKGKQCVVMFVGLQGSGKTTTCTKYASYYKKKGFKPSLVCADTFRAGAFDQLKQNATRANVPYFGSYTETDPVAIAQAGVKKFKEENSDLIIVDTSGRHKQEASLFEEMRQLSTVTNPDLVIFVMDSSIGQAAFDQAQAFRQSVPVGAVIITKIDGHAKGGGALSAVAATKSPVIFLGTGEHIDELRLFEVKPFVNGLLGMGDLSGFMNRIHDAVPMKQQAELVQKMSEGALTLRIMYLQYSNMLNLGPFNEVFSTIPGFNAKGQERDCGVRMKKFMTIMDSMTNKELDSTNLKMLLDATRINRIARGSGCTVREVHEMLETYKMWAKASSEMKGLKMKGDMRAMSRNMNAQHMRQYGGMGGLQNLMKQVGLKDFGKDIGAARD